ncbi:MFS transporter [Rathayibacter sp. YIM 133350]|uniref:MFS transporter n=1 Tax=Rathayibacter sp. YIM 133350 TaxID=3131992 RepID=UPI00307E7C68
MIIRRAFYYALFPAVVVLPAWTLIGWGIFGHGGWALLGLIIAAPVMAIALAVVALLVFARPQVRRERAVSWMDAAYLAVWYACLIAFGFLGETATLFAVLGVAAALTAFWLSLSQLYRAGVKGVRDTMAAFERQAAAPATQQAVIRHADGEDEVIIVREVKP